MDYVIQHHGILGQRWGIRRFQNPDGSLTEAGKKRYLNSDGTLTRKGDKKMSEAADAISHPYDNKYKKKRLSARQYLDGISREAISNNSTLTELSQKINNSPLNAAMKEFDKLTYADYKPYLDKQLEKQYDTLPENERKSISKRDYVKSKQGSIDSGEDGIARALWLQDKVGGKEKCDKLVKEYDNYSKAWNNELRKSVENIASKTTLKQLVDENKQDPKKYERVKAFMHLNADIVAEDMYNRSYDVDDYLSKLH